MDILNEAVLTMKPIEFSAQLEHNPQEQAIVDLQTQIGESINRFQRELESIPGIKPKIPYVLLVEDEDPLNPEITRQLSIGQNGAWEDESHFGIGILSRSGSSPVADEVLEYFAVINDPKYREFIQRSKTRSSVEYSLDREAFIKSERDRLLKELEQRLQKKRDLAIKGKGIELFEVQHGY